MKDNKKGLKNIKETFYKSEKEQEFLNHLDNRADAFWEGVSFLKRLNDERIDNETASFFHARFFITGRLINHIVAAYQLLKMGLHDEFLVMYRQCLENSWLLKYFIKNPNDTKKWMDLKNPKEIWPSQRRKALEDKETADRIYTELCNIVHSNHKSFFNGLCIGGYFNQWLTDQLFGHLIAVLNDSIGYFMEIMDLFNIDFYKDKKEIALLYEHIVQKIGWCIYETSFLKDPVGTIAHLKKLGDEDAIRYFEEKYEIVY